jgi:hypothetical protein
LVTVTVQLAVPPADTVWDPGDSETEMKSLPPPPPPWLTPPPLLEDAEGVTAADALDAGPVPALLVAVTVNV